MLAAVIGAVGASKRGAFANLVGAVAGFGSDWPVSRQAETVTNTDIEETK